MESHDTHYIGSKGSSKNEKNFYKYDKCGNILIDSIDDLIYEKYITNNKKEKIEKNEKDNYSSLINDNKSHNLIKSINNELKEKSIETKNIINLRIIPIKETSKNII